MLTSHMVFKVQSPFFCRKRMKLHIPLLISALLSACSSPSLQRNAETSPPASFPASSSIPIEAAWTEIGPSSQIFARVILRADANCPGIQADGNTIAMQLRAGAASIPLRTTASDPKDSRPSEFPVTSCEATLPAGTKQAQVAGRTLPLPKAEPQRVVIFGDTGCRLKKADNAWQACDDSTAWPFAKMSTVMAGFKPELVIHVGDYHYRENACPPDVKGCQGSPWGYGWDTWQADFFKPAASLLAQAPWVMARGNHEECLRGGQGWMRFLDPFPFSEDRACNDPAKDDLANYSEPYAVSLGNATQLIVFDSARASKTPLKTTDKQFQIYEAQFRSVATLAAKGGMRTTMFTNHHPILGFAPIPGANPFGGQASLLSVLGALNAQAYYPAGIDLALHGHVHDFQAISFASGQPATIVSGTGGDNLDVNLPDPMPANAMPAPGTIVEQLAHHASFGFVLATPRTNGSWQFEARSVEGKLLATCQLEGRKLVCDKKGLITP